jgi:hypothetical protein
MTLLEPGWTRRTLTEGEREEVRAAGAHVRRFPPRLAVMTAMVVGVLAWTARSGGGLRLVLLVLFGLVVLGMAWGRWLRARGLGARFASDADGGWVARSERDGREVLPTSRARWTEAGAPADWRARYAARR